MCGFLLLQRSGLSRGQRLAVLAFAKGITGKVSPMRPVPLITDPNTCVLARWGWPGQRGGILTHARTETAAELPTWRRAWRERRGVIPVEGWLEGSWQVDSPGAHLAVLWTGHNDGARLVILTQDPGAHRTAIERFPVPLTEEGAIEWMEGGGLDQQVRDVQVRGRDGQATIFDL